jgi:hypothetical protein
MVCLNMQSSSVRMHEWRPDVFSFMAQLRARKSSRAWSVPGLL